MWGNGKKGKRLLLTERQALKSVLYPYLLETSQQSYVNGCFIELATEVQNCPTSHQHCGTELGSDFKALPVFLAPHYRLKARLSSKNCFQHRPCSVAWQTPCPASPDWLLHCL